MFDTISDNAANAAVVLGGKRFRPAEVDLCWVAAILTRNGEIEDTGVAGRGARASGQGPGPGSPTSSIRTG